ncbi:hypothetical protein AJ80_03473 [Polytolypa hystricis UAMH7299]|uniref:C3H1-type domain-containing protein n=1 Tax=Polytolypa hystricis (strain UAMH7299) TaxID=1447883 RepID=A0A2B7YI59_POLH7|nr:hypothetical protein AJ80_03473 [Polytolypa hystricis UAMH7299]
MVSEETYELCLPVLQDEKLEDEEKIEKLEEFLREKTELTGSSLENTVLDVLHLWRHRSTQADTSPPPLRHTVIRRSSPAPWQIPRSSTPLSSPSNTGTSPAAGFPVPRGGFPRAPRSLAASPFTSPRPSPRLALAQPIPHSPNLNAYEFSATSGTPDFYGDMGSDNVDWLVSDDARSTASSTGLNGAAPEWIAPPDMDPYDMLRSVLGDRKSNEEIEEALEANSYDLGATIAALTEPHHNDGNVAVNNEGRVLVGKSMAMENMRPVTPSGPSRSPVICKYWLSTGQCLRADCRFSHDLRGHLCKYWMMGNCLAGDGCPFSHDPTAQVGSMSISDNGSMGATPDIHPPYQFDNYEAFPTLYPAGPEQFPPVNPRKQPHHFQSGNQQYHLSPNYRKNAALGSSSRPHSRPGSRHQHRELNPSTISVDDPEAFPTLSAVSSKGRKHHGKRGGHGHHRDGSGNKDATPNSLADVVRMSSSPAPSHRKGGPRSSRPSTANRELSAAAQAIPEPTRIPWLETGARANQQYLKYRLDAITHGNVRNKFLQSAAQAWNRNDARAAKALSLRGQAENEAMRRAHREAARHLYEERNKHLNSMTHDDELYIDLHGLHPNEAIEYLEKMLLEQAKLGCRLLYVITGTGHHSKNGKDKVGKATKNWLNEWRFVFREFNVPGERGGYVGGILGVDPTSYDRSLAAKSNSQGVDAADGASRNSSSGPVLTMGKIQLLKREDAPKKE